MIPLALIILIVATVAFVATSGTPGKPLFQKPFSGCGCVALLLVFLIFLYAVSLGPIGRQPHLPESAAMQTCRTLALAMFQYANDNDGDYPDGASSTEVFQKLVDGNYISDPAILFVPLPGKVVAKSGVRLKPENVAYDVTFGVNAQSPDSLPVVFLTGYRLDYHPGGSAVSLVRPFPSTARNWFERWFVPDQTFSGLPVAYHNNNAFFRVGKIGPDGMGVVPNVIAPDFDARGRTYIQLTPDGPLK